MRSNARISIGNWPNDISKLRDNGINFKLDHNMPIFECTQESLLEFLEISEEELTILLLSE